MKVSSLIHLIALLTLSTSNAYAQQTNKPKLFEHIPQLTRCEAASIDTFFLIPQGQSINKAIASGITIDGFVIYNQQKQQNLQTAFIKLVQYDDAILSITKYKKENGDIEFSGRIYNEKYSDALLLTKNNTGQYNFEKAQANEIVFSCDKN